MELIERVDPIEIKRCFVISELVRSPEGNKRYLGTISRENFRKKLLAIKRKVLKLKEADLDEIVSERRIGKNPWAEKRLKAYNNCVWWIGEARLKEIGVWRRAGGLPLSWTNNTLTETAKIVKASLKSKSKLIKKRAKHAIANILETNIENLQQEKYLLPIMFKGGGRHQRQALLKNQNKTRY